MSGAETIAAFPSAKARQPDRLKEAPGLLVILIQVLLVALILRHTSIETLGFHRALYIAAGGFVINHLLAPRFRLRFFLLLSLVSMAVALGGRPVWGPPSATLGVARTLLVFGMGIVLIAICRLKIRFWWRGALLLAAGAVAAVLRVAQWNSTMTAVVWPVLAALFMFRIIVYLYDVSTAAQAPTRTQSLAYFFLTPNFCALLFPVIDFRTFCQKYYDEEALAIYQRGVTWMTRGVIHLLVYRLVFHLFALDASEVANGTDLVRFAVTNMLLYLKVSGSFHLYIGILLLFGFNLPETNHRYFLASSFTDYWRRINTYWRAFIMKVFYYPIFFRFKARGQLTAVVISTLACFFVTWGLHIYQTWWIKGAVSWTWTDALFWTGLAVLVLANSLIELRRGRQRKLTRGCATWGEGLGVVLRTALTFVTLTVLWSLWSTPTLGLWLHIWSLADLHTLALGGATVACVMAATVVCEVLPGRDSRPSREPAPRGPVPMTALTWGAFRCALSLSALLVAVYFPELSRRVAPGLQLPTATALARVALDGAATRQGAGYYENLTTANEGLSQYWETLTTIQEPFMPDNSTFTNDANAVELVPNLHAERNGLHFDTNRWGMRDRDHELTKPPMTLRMAVLGSSNVMGYGLPANAMFESALEKRLNGDHAGDGGFELLNFAVPGQSPMGQIWTLRERVLAFHPDIVLFVAHACDFEWVNRDVVRALRNHVPLPPDFPAHLLPDAGVTSRTLAPFAEERLGPHEPEMVAYCYRQIVRQCQAADALAVLVFIPLPANLPGDKQQITDLLQIAGNAGFTTIDLSHVFAEYKTTDLMLRDKGHHSTAKAQAILASALYERLTTDPRIELVARAKRIGARFAYGSTDSDSPH